MILIDFNGVAISSVMAQLKGSSDFDEALIRHIVLNNLRHARTKFRGECGEIVICMDGHNSWRKQIYPYYKAHRKTDRETSTFDWAKMFEIIDKIKSELKQYFPYKFIQIEGLEADDVIGTLAIREPGPHAIISNDKDFIQLLRIPNITIYSPVKSNVVKNKEPEKFLIEHIIKGDKSDGIPNILSADDTFVTRKRQRPIRETKVLAWISSRPEDVFSPEVLENYRRNEALISLFKIPDEIQQKAIDSYYTESSRIPRSELLNYFMKYNLRNMLDKITEF